MAGSVKIAIIQKEIKRPGKAQCILVLLNLLIFIVGISITFIGYATINKRMFEKLMKWVTKKGVPKPLLSIIKNTVQKSGFISGYLLFSGIVISIVSFLGCCGAWCSRKLLKWYMIILTVMILMIAGAGYAAHRQANNSVIFLAEGLGKIFVHYDQPEARKAILTIQVKGKCCGGLGPQDWQENEIFHEKFNQYLVNGNFDVTGDFPVPDSCCTRPSNGCGLRNNETHAQAFEDVVDQIWGGDTQAFQADKEKYETHASGTWEEHNAEYSDYDDYYNDDYNYDYSGNGTVDWDEWMQETDDYYVYEDHFSSPHYRSAESADSSDGRFTNTNDVQSGLAPEDQHIYKYGCAVKYGNMIRRSKTQILVGFFVLALPEIICLIMASKVNKYFKLKEDEMEE